MLKNNKKIFTLVLILSLLVPSTYASEKSFIQGVPIINQYPELPTGCEATALTMLLQYYGLDISKEQVARDMPQSPLPQYKNGVYTADHPNNTFIGSPFNSRSYGVYAPVIYNMLNDYFPGQAINLSGSDFSQIYTAIDEGRPVILWVSIGMENIRTGNKWTTPDGKVFSWLSPEHAVVMVGYDDTYIYINDPYTGSQKKYPKNTVINRWVGMGKQAVALKTPPASQQTVTINDITFEDALRVDFEGEWFPVRNLPTIDPLTTFGYNPYSNTVSIQIVNPQLLPEDSATWLVTLPDVRLQAIPYNISNRYDVQINLIPDHHSILTYKPNTEHVILNYKTIDGTSYISIDWIEAFYDAKITY